MPGPSIPSWLDPEIYPFTHHYADLPPGRLHYVDEGSGLPVVMVHGNPAWSFLYRHLVSHLRNRYRCIAPDHIGFGLSDKPAEWSYRPEVHANNLAELIDRLDIDEITLVVQDWGGPIGLSYAVENPARVRRIVVLNTWMWPVNRDPYYLAYRGLMGSFIGRFLIRRYNFFARTVMPMMFASPAKLSPHIHDHYLKPLQSPSDRRGCWTFAREVTGSTEWLDRLWSRSDRLEHVEFLIVWGMQDIAFRERELDRWIERFPDAAVERIEEAGHFLQEEAPARLNDALDRFLRPARDST